MAIESRAAQNVRRRLAKQEGTDAGRSEVIQDRELETGQLLGGQRIRFSDDGQNIGEGRKATDEFNVDRFKSCKELARDNQMRREPTVKDDIEHDVDLRGAGSREQRR